MWECEGVGISYSAPSERSLFYFYFLMEFNESCSFGRSVLEHPRRGMSGGDYKVRIFSVSVIVVIMIRFFLYSFFFSSFSLGSKKSACYAISSTDVMH